MDYWTRARTSLIMSWPSLWRTFLSVVSKPLSLRLAWLSQSTMLECSFDKGIRVGRQVVNVAFFMVRVDSQKHIDFSLTSPIYGGCPGRVKRKNQKSATKKAAGGDVDDKDEE
ncbi:hypothetical protein AABB24_000452 [Solanum stoloniferum]|uniref:Uncharacterized protein n=1 Tax=Solanum stoloniferum TaxID=62892 RepID=A0ABD2VJE5_9SOLN